MNSVSVFVIGLVMTGFVFTLVVFCSRSMKVQNDTRPLSARICELLLQTYLDGSQISIALNLHDEDDNELRLALISLYELGLIQVKLDPLHNSDPRGFMDAVWGLASGESTEQQKKVAERVLALKQDN